MMIITYMITDQSNNLYSYGAHLTMSILVHYNVYAVFSSYLAVV